MADLCGAGVGSAILLSLGGNCVCICLVAGKISEISSENGFVYSGNLVSTTAMQLPALHESLPGSLTPFSNPMEME